MDPGQFLASTGSQVMSDLNRLRSRAQRSPGPNPWEIVGEALKFGKSITPVNLWAIVDKWRNAPPLPQDRIE
jgi:hypothetical protein